MDFSAVTNFRAIRLLKATLDDWLEDNALRLSAALAYYSIFSIAPLLIIAISIAGFVLGADAVDGSLDNQLKAYVGAEAAEALQAMVKSASKPSDSWVGAIVGFLTLLLGASGVFGQLKDALNTIWEVKAKGGGGIKGFLRERLLTFGMVLVIGFLLLTSLALTTVLAAMGQYLERVIGIPTVVSGALAFGASFALVAVLFAFIFKILPDVRIEWRHVWIGAFVTALLFEAGKFGLGFYLGRESTASSFGAAGSLVLLLLWVYYASCILLFGAEFTQVFARESGHRIVPARGAVAVTRKARAQQGLMPEAAIENEPSVPVAQATSIVSVDSSPKLLPTLFAVTASSFAIGLLARHLSGDREKPPGALVREGVKGLSADAAERLLELLQGTRREIVRRVR